jgi:putative spermidine/putrescine transport system permease protein
MRAWLLVAPAAALLVIGLVLPIGLFLLRSVDNAEIHTALPRTVVAIEAWDGKNLPPDAVYDAFGADVAAAAAPSVPVSVLGDLARRLNFLVPGSRTLIGKTGNAYDAGAAGNARSQLIGIDPRWGRPEIWTVLKQEAGRYTASYYLAALDLKRAPTGEIVSVEERSRIFVSLFTRTFAISFVVAVLCLLLGYPAAHLLATAPARWTPLLFGLVLLPFWTSTLVRTTAWVVLLQSEGLINRSLRFLGIIDQPLALFANRFAVLVAMTYVLLPYMILPLYGVMKSVPPELMRAAGNLGANPLRAFFRVYLPQTFPGISAGFLLVFILALGYYVTPALVGGPSDQMISYFIALYTNETLNWGLASALGCVLLVATALLYVVFSRFGDDKLRGAA